MIGTLVLLAALVLCACGLVAYRARWLGAVARGDRFRDYANDLMVANRETRDELTERTHEADYWRELVAWMNDHDRSPTQEECDLMWQHVIERKSFASPEPVKLPESFSYFTVDGLIRASGGKPS